MKTGKKPTPSAIDGLPFVGPFPNRDPKGSTFPRCFWANVQSTGDFTEDQRLGAQYALLAMRAMAADGFPPLLFWILEDMQRQECPEPIRVGFIHAVAEATMIAGVAPTLN
jgi:hypothetical protein